MTRKIYEVILTAAADDPAEQLASAFGVPASSVRPLQDDAPAVVYFEAEALSGKFSTKLSVYAEAAIASQHADDASLARRLAARTNAPVYYAPAEDHELADAPDAWARCSPNGETEIVEREDL